MADESKKSDQDPAPGSEADEPTQSPANATGRGASDAAAADVATLEGQIAELTDRLLRAHAEMDNFRKRTERDKEDTAKYAITKFAREVLSVGDNLQRAIAAVPSGAAEEDPALKALVDGVAMTEREFLNVLDRHGVKRIDPEGEPFNPHQHQAMTEDREPRRPAGNGRPGISPGYMLGGQGAASGDGRDRQGRRKARQGRQTRQPMRPTRGRQGRSVARRLGARRLEQAFLIKGRSAPSQPLLQARDSRGEN